jgi:tetratricopeptide (TPR) repeat protein
MKSPFKLQLLLITALLLFIHINVVAQRASQPAYQQCSDLVLKGAQSMEAGNLSEALEYFTKADLLAAKNNYEDKLFPIKINLGIIYQKFSNYGEALGQYQSAYNLAQKSGSEKDLAKALGNIGVLYSREKDYKNALKYYKQAYPLTTDKEATYVRLMLAINMSDLYNKMGNFNEARKYLNDVKNLPKSKKVEQLWVINYADSYIVEGRPDKALKMIDEIVNNIDKKREGVCYVCVAELLSKVYYNQNKTELAIKFARQGLRNTPQMPEKIELYDQLSRLHLKRGEYDLAFQYKDSVLIAKDSISVLINNGLYESNKVKLKVQEYQSELQAKTEKQQAQLYFFVVIIVVCLLTSFAIYKGLKNKIVRQNQEKVIIQRNQEIINLELEKKNLELEKINKEHLLTEQELETIKNAALLKQEQLKNKISEKNRELSAKALYLSIRNELIESSINSLSAIPAISKNTSVSNHIKILQRHLKSDTGWEEFINHFEKVNPAFLKALKEKHPTLNGKDIRFVCCIFMNLDVKEIGNIFNITYNAASKRKQRIKEKMGVDNEASLYEYLLNLDNGTTISSTEIEDQEYLAM